MKRYYSPNKDFSHRKPLQITYKVIRFFAKIGYKKPELIFTDEKFTNDDLVMLVPNHTKIFAPKYFLIQKEIKTRLWVNCYFLDYKDCYRHLKTRVVYNLKPKYLLRFLSFILTPLITNFFRSILPIPAYHKDERVDNITIKKSVESFDEGLVQVVFAERTEPKVNDYLYQINYGFTKVAKSVYEKEHKCVKFFPVYCCQDLNKILIGKPYVYNPNIEHDVQKKIISDYIEAEIEKLAKSLPEHKIVLYVD